MDRFEVRKRATLETRDSAEMRALDVEPCWDATCALESSVEVAGRAPSSRRNLRESVRPSDVVEVIGMSRLLCRLRMHRWGPLQGAGIHAGAVRVCSSCGKTKRSGDDGFKGAGTGGSGYGPGVSGGTGI